MKKLLIGLALVLISSIGYCGEMPKDEDIRFCFFEKNSNQKYDVVCAWLLRYNEIDLNSTAKNLLKFKNGSFFRPEILNKDDIIFYSILLVSFETDKNGRLLKDWNNLPIPKRSSIFTNRANCETGVGITEILNVSTPTTLMDPIFENNKAFLLALDGADPKIFGKTSIAGKSLILACNYVKKYGDDVQKQFLEKQEQNKTPYEFKGLKEKFTDF